MTVCAVGSATTIERGYYIEIKRAKCGMGICCSRCDRHHKPVNTSTGCSRANNIGPSKPYGCICTYVATVDPCTDILVYKLRPAGNNHCPVHCVSHYGGAHMVGVILMDPYDIPQYVKVYRCGDKTCTELHTTTHDICTQH